MDYEEMYYMLFAKVAKVIEELIQIQRDAEQMYIEKETLDNDD